eukprot:9003819-Alexandrium_andersonii.AAC.1
MYIKCQCSLASEEGNKEVLPDQKMYRAGKMACFASCRADRAAELLQASANPAPLKGGDATD